MKSFPEHSRNLCLGVAGKDLEGLWGGGAEGAGTSPDVAEPRGSVPCCSAAANCSSTGSRHWENLSRKSVERSLEWPGRSGYVRWARAVSRSIRWYAMLRNSNLFAVDEKVVHMMRCIWTVGSIVPREASWDLSWRSVVPYWVSRLEYYNI